MITAEGADEKEVIVRPSVGGGWRIEIPRKAGGTLTIVVIDQLQALSLARRLRPEAHLRLLPALPEVETWKAANVKERPSKTSTA